MTAVTAGGVTLVLARLTKPCEFSLEILHPSLERLTHPRAVVGRDVTQVAADLVEFRRHDRGRSPVSASALAR